MQSVIRKEGSYGLQIRPQFVPAERSRLHFSIPLCEQTWVDRILRACEVIEGDPTLPREPLSYVLCRDRLELIDDRPAFLEDLLDHRHRYLLLSSASGAPIDEGHVSITGVVNDAARQSYDLTVEFPAMPWEVRESLLAAIGDALGAHNGHITPARAAQIFASYYSLGTVPPEGVHPARAGWELDTYPLRECMHRLSVIVPRIQNINVGGGRVSPLQPAIAGWMNYWSEGTCSFLGFPRQGRDEDLLAAATQTPQGSWIVKLCDEPLDLAVDAHVTAIADVYERFSRLGIRV